jgi:hypothetical protein
VANCTQNSTSILYFYKLTLSCLPNCPDHYFADNSSLACVTLCANNTFGYSPTRQCLTACPDGWFADTYSFLCV